MLDLLRSLEWCATAGPLGEDWSVCPECRSPEHNGKHSPACRLDRAIRDLASSAIEEVPVDKPCPHHGPIQRPLPPSNRVHCQACGATWDEVGRRVDGEPTVDEMAREMGLGPWRPPVNPNSPGDELTADAIRTLYHEHKAKQIDATLAGKRVGPWLTPPAPKVYEASGPPIDPSALAAWLYARVAPGRTVVERGGEYKAVVRSVARGRRCIILTGPDGEQVTAPGTLNLHLLNPDGTVLWEAK